MRSLYPLLHIRSTQKLSCIRSVLLILILFINGVDLTYSTLSTYFERFRIHLRTAKHLLLDKRLFYSKPYVQVMCMFSLL